MDCVLGKNKGKINIFFGEEVYWNVIMKLGKYLDKEFYRNMEGEGMEKNYKGKEMKYKQKGVIEQIKEKMMDFLYPRTCPVCGEVVGEKEEKVCTECKEKLVYIKNPSCSKCGKPLQNFREQYCRDCKRHAHYFDRGKAVWVYNKELRESIYRFKYDNKREYADFYIEEIVKRHGGWIKSLGVEVIIPVPLHKKKQKSRGFNQAEVLARGIGKALNIPVETKLICRQKNTVAQKELNSKERQKNLKNAFKIVQNDVQLRKVLLVDDIYTTGSTIDAMATVLKSGGVKEVYMICLGTGGVD